jgi:AhpD family alkylhydroperoxidase
VNNFYDASNVKHLRKLKELKPDTFRLYLDWNKEVFKEGALPAKTKQLMAVVAAEITQCPWCIEDHTKRAKDAGATEAELAEAAFVAMAMRAGGAFAHSCISFGVFEEHGHK